MDGHVQHDGFGRDINYLRIAVTDKCNFRCIYCMPADGVAPRAHDELLSAEEIARFVRLCDAFSVPVVTVVDTEGFVPSVSDDIAGGIREAARLAATYADATTAKVALLSGKAVGPVYTALANADLKIAVNGCTVSALEPNAAVSVLYKAEIDASDNIIAATKAKAAAYTAEVCSAASAVAAGAADMSCDAANVRASVVAALELLSTKRAARLPKKHGNMAL